MGVFIGGSIAYYPGVKKRKKAGNKGKKEWVAHYRTDVSHPHGLP
jgi:hypothetical protein